VADLKSRYSVYARLLMLYPASYRQQYSDQMLQTLEDMLDHTSGIERQLIWLKVLGELPFSVARQQYSYLGGIMVHNTPTYIKRSSLAGAVLLLPFFMFVVLNSLTNHALNNSTLWQRGVLFTWIILFPSVALLINAMAFVVWLIHTPGRQKAKLWSRLFDVAQSWPMLLISVLAVGILAVVFFHDSVHCVTGNPISELQNWHTTLRCIRQG